MNKKEVFHSIADAMKEETLVSSASIQEYQDDLRLAEKERLQSVQKRSHLLESLRKSIKKQNRETNGQTSIGDDFSQTILEGNPEEIERCITLYQKQLKDIQSKTSVSKITSGAIRQFSDRTNAFLEKKRMMQKVEKTVNTLLLSNRSANTNSNIDLTLARLSDVKTVIHKDILSLTQEITSQIEILEAAIVKDILQEEKQRALFFTGLSCVDDDRKSKLISLCHQKTHDKAYDARVSFYKTLVGQLVKIDDRVARKIHSHIRKEARALLNEGQYKSAVSELCYALHLRNNDVSTYRLLADIFFRTKDEKNAYVALGEVLRLTPEDDRLRKRMAEYWTRKNILPKAINEYQKLLTRQPEDQSIRRALGCLLENTKSYSLIPNVLLDYIRKSEDRECLSILGRAYIHLHEWEKGIFYLRKSLDIDPSQLDAYHLMTLAYRELDHHEQAIQLLEWGIQSNPDSNDLKILLGSLYIDCEKWDRALEILQPLLSLLPDSPSLLVHLGEIRLSIGNVDEAISLFSKANEHNPNNSQICCWLARAHRKINDVQNAEIFFNRALQCDPLNIEIKQETGAFFAERGQWQKAAEIFKSVQNNGVQQ